MSRWVIHSRTGFDAGHALASYGGAPEESHNHRWEIAIRVGADDLNPEGFALDFHQVHRILDEFVAPLKGIDLNLHAEIGTPSPSAERVAQVASTHLEPRLEAIGGTLLSVSVWEGPENRVDLCLDP